MDRDALIFLGLVVGGPLLLLLGIRNALIVPRGVQMGGYQQFRQVRAVAGASLVGGIATVVAMSAVFGQIGIGEPVLPPMSLAATGAIWYALFRTYRRKASPVIKFVAKSYGLHTKDLVQSMREDLEVAAADLGGFLEELASPSNNLELERQMHEELVRVHAPDLADTWSAVEDALHKNRGAERNL